MTELRLPALLLAFGLAGGCGLKGGLYLPEPESPPAATAPTAPGTVTSGGEQQEDLGQQDQRGD